MCTPAAITASVTGTLCRIRVALRTRSVSPRAAESEPGSSTSTRSTRSGAPRLPSSFLAASGRRSPIVISWSVRATRSATATDAISPDPPRTRILLMGVPFWICGVRSPLRDNSGRGRFQPAIKATFADVELRLSTRDQLHEDESGHRSGGVAERVSGTDEQAGQHLVDDRPLVGGERQ